MNQQLIVYGVLILATIPHMKNYVVKTISLSPEILHMGLERARQFRLPFSQHVARLIEDDYRSGSTRIVIVADPPPKPPPERAR